MGIEGKANKTMMGIWEERKSWKLMWWWLWLQVDGKILKEGLHTNLKSNDLKWFGIGNVELKACKPVFKFCGNLAFGKMVSLHLSACQGKHFVHRGNWFLIKITKWSDCPAKRFSDVTVERFGKGFDSEVRPREVWG